MLSNICGHKSCIHACGKGIVITKFENNVHYTNKIELTYRKLCRNPTSKYILYSKGKVLMTTFFSNNKISV